MTVLLDPGTDPNSFKDAAIRQWKATAGLWKGDAVDSGNSTADPSWSGATQEYSTTAADWKALYNSEVAAYNAGIPRGLSYATCSGFGGSGGGNGNWQTCTLNNQSNTGLTFFSSGTVITIPRTGYYTIEIRAHANTTNGGQKAGIRLLKNSVAGFGVTLGQTSAEAQPDDGSGSGQYGADMGCACLVSCSAGDTIQVQEYQSWGFSADSLWIAFLPTPANPQ